MFKKYIQNKLEKYTRRYFATHPDVKLVVVAGSVGKTTTKTHIAEVLSTKYRVAMQEGNHNTHMSVPLAILGIAYPANIRNIFAWLKVFNAARKRIQDKAGTDIIIAELGTDHPGELAHFGTYLRPDIAVITGVTPEHMEFFGSIDAVAQEELSVANFSKLALINRDDIEGRFANFLTNQSIDTYGTTNAAEYRFEVEDFTLEHGYNGAVIAPEFPNGINAKVTAIGEHSLRPVMAAVGVAAKLGMTGDEITKSLTTIRPVSGRMNILRGVDYSTIIDDSYNSSPAAAAAALQTLYTLQAPQRIALLGSMNELGASSAEEHQRIGNLCDSNLLAWVVTVGDEAEKYLAPYARQRGCQVRSFKSAIDAGAFVHSVMEEHAVILAKGSQGGIYLEEAIKLLLHETDEEHMLVRQSPAWLKQKSAFFASLK